MTMLLYKKNIPHPGFIVFNFEARFDKKSDNSAVIFNFVQNIFQKALENLILLVMKWRFLKKTHDN